MTQTGVVVLMCGLPGSGKTGYARVLERQGYTRLSIDEEIWRRIGRDAADLDPAEYTRLQQDAEARQWQELIALLRARKPVVVDYSFASRARRNRYRTLVAEHGGRCEIVYLKADLPTLRRRLAARNQLDGPNSVTVATDLLHRYAASFEEPCDEGERVIQVS
ncbi:MAG TPA: ATP-binding protein [Pseudonocardiaceae bacterium]|jgi:predicted kinase|nr:ATP-binding protein [Pseudonocardiaceae bacterium]